MKLLKTIGIIVLSVVLSVATVSIINRADVNISLENEANLIHTIEEYQSKADKLSNGLTIKENKNGSITVSGKYDETATSNYEFIFGTVLIEEEDFYTLSGFSDAALDACYLVATYDDGEGNVVNIIGDFSDMMTSTEKLSEGTQVLVKLVIKPGCELDNATFKPTFVAGKEPGRF